MPGNPVEGGSRNPVDHVAALAMRFTFRSVQKRHASLRTPRSTSVIVGQTGNFAIREADSLVDRSPTCHSSRKYFPIARQVYTLRIMHLESSEPMAGSCVCLRCGSPQIRCGNCALGSPLRDFSCRNRTTDSSRAAFRWSRGARGAPPSSDRRPRRHAASRISRWEGLGRWPVMGVTYIEH